MSQRYYEDLELGVALRRMTSGGHTPSRRAID
jgi:hypothetical protein